jgi:hypothetical protein
MSAETVEEAVAQLTPEQRTTMAGYALAGWEFTLHHSRIWSAKNHVTNANVGARSSLSSLLTQIDYNMKLVDCPAPAVTDD